MNRNIFYVILLALVSAGPEAIAANAKFKDQVQANRFFRNAGLACQDYPEKPYEHVYVECEENTGLISDSCFFHIRYGLDKSHTAKPTIRFFVAPQEFMNIMPELMREHGGRFTINPFFTCPEIANYPAKIIAVDTSREMTNYSTDDDRKSLPIRITNIPLPSLPRTNCRLEIEYLDEAGFGKNFQGKLEIYAKTDLNETLIETLLLPLNGKQDRVIPVLATNNPEETTRFFISLKNAPDLKAISDGQKEKQEFEYDNYGNQPNNAELKNDETIHLTIYIAKSAHQPTRHQIKYEACYTVSYPDRAPSFESFASEDY